MLKKKKLLHSAYKSFYNDMSKICDLNFPSHGLEIELGSGVGFFKKIRSSILTSEFIRKGIDYDMELDATNMKLSNNSVKCIFGINVFHHISFPTKFFKELDRVLVAGGGCILIEPHNGFLSKLLCKNMHKDEYFDENAQDWDSTKKNGPLDNANQALSYIVFERDKLLFEKRYGHNLKIIHKQYILNGFRYIFSGGLNFKQFLPSFTLFLLKAFEIILSPFAKFWTPFRMIVIKKVN
jgi:SAM-dependent methyltransferase